MVQGKFLAINMATMSCACPRSPQGLSPSAHLADGTGDLILVRESHPLGFLKFLHRHTSSEDQVGPLTRVGSLRLGFRSTDQRNLCVVPVVFIPFVGALSR